MVAAPRLGSEDFVTASPEALGISAGERSAEAAARCQAKVAYADLCVDTACVTSRPIRLCSSGGISSVMVYLIASA